jgi:5-methylcytosine-specific restriction endonuclease McrA
MRARRVRVAKVRCNPEWLKPADEVTDRALRYRAWHPDVVPLGRMQCVFCGSVINVLPHHVNGNETETVRENLVWACKGCNGSVGHRLRKNGIGRLTKQYNPGKARAKSRDQALKDYQFAILVMRGKIDGDVAAAVRTIKATPPALRSEYTRKQWPLRRERYGESGRAQGRLAFDDVPF